MEFKYSDIASDLNLASLCLVKKEYFLHDLLDK